MLLFPEKRKRKDSLDGNRRGEGEGGHLSTLGLDAVEDKVLTVTLIPTLELSSQQRSVCLSQEGVTDVGMFSAVRGQRVWSNAATFPISCCVCGVLQLQWLSSCSVENTQECTWGTLKICKKGEKINSVRSITQEI